MCSATDTKVVPIGVECACCREPETPHTHAHDSGLVECLTNNTRREIPHEE